MDGKGDRMKIRIVTFQRADNYGAVLQCYALFSYIKRLNLDTKVLDYRNPYIESQYSIIPENGKIKKKLTYIIKNLLPSYKWQFLRKKRFESFRKLIEFTDSKWKQELKKDGVMCDLLISGSDQVLNPDITNGIDDVYFLNIPCNAIRASYGASIGSLNSQYVRSETFLDKLSNIDFLSVREQDASDYIKKTLGKNVVQCVDPTLLLEKKEWDEIIENTQYESAPEKYILLYYLEKNQNLIEVAEKIAEIKKIPILYFNKKTKLNCESKFCGDAGPLEFIWLIKNASIIITSSFHASVFSFIYEKKVCIMTHSKTGARVASLAKLFNGQDFICSSVDDAVNKLYIKCDYDQKFLKLMRNQSTEYIKYIIKKAEEKNES